MEKYNTVTLIFYHLNVLRCKKITAYCRFVIDVIPKVLLIFKNQFFCKAIEIEVVLLLCNSKHNHSTLTISEGRISIPKSSWETTSSTFEF